MSWLRIILCTLVLAVCGCKPPELGWGYWEPPQHTVDYDAELDKPIKWRAPESIPLMDLIE